MDLSSGAGLWENVFYPTAKSPVNDQMEEVMWTESQEMHGAVPWPKRDWGRLFCVKIGLAWVNRACAFPKGLWQMCETSCSPLLEQCHSWELTFQLCFACFHISKVSKDKMKVLDKLVLLKLMWLFKFLELLQEKMLKKEKAWLFFTLKQVHKIRAF